MKPSFDVLVIGGGVVGLTAALAMAVRHDKVAVFDHGELKINQLTDVDKRVYAMNQASQDLLLQLDVWQHLDASRMTPYQRMYVWDALSGAYIDFDSRCIAAPFLGTMIEEVALKNALLEQLAHQPTVSLFSNTRVDKVSFTDHSVQIAHQDEHWDGQLLMVADGAHSPLRQMLKVPLSTRSYHQHALIATVTTEKKHQNTAYQVFHPDGPLAFLPLANPHQSSIVWSTKPDRVQTLMSLDEQGFNEEVSHAFAHQLGQVVLASARHQFPLSMRHVTQYTGSRWMLLGDCAHTIHPLAGLGLNVGLADVASWLRCLQHHRGDLASPKRLGAYQRERKHSVWQTILLMDALKRIFSYSSPPLSKLRALGLRACNELPVLKQWFIHHASGKPLL